jgi:hypothetical protein
VIAGKATVKIRLSPHQVSDLKAWLDSRCEPKGAA